MSFLNKIIEYKKSQLPENKYFGMPENELEKLCLDMPPVKSFIKRLEENSKNGEISLIAEVKKASPSKGLIREDFHPVEIAKIYQESGASAISVLTEDKFFLGSDDYLIEVKKNVDIPVLRKDFIVSTLQIYETRLLGADLILLIASALSKQELFDFFTLSKRLGLEVLVEVHDEEEFDLATELKAKIIGINNRNLKTFDVSINNTVNIIKQKDISNRYIISESGISSHDEVVYLKNNGVSGILVGESFMRQDNIQVAVQNLLNKKL